MCRLSFGRKQPRNQNAGFTYLEVLMAITLLLGTMAMAMSFFLDFGAAMNTESTTLSTQQSSRIALDELTRYLRQIGYGLYRPDPYNPSKWQRALVYGGSHAVAFNADIDPAIGHLPSSQVLSFPSGPSYTGEGIGATTLGAETIMFTLDADGDGNLEIEDRSHEPTGTFNPAAETQNPMDFGLFQRVYGFNGSDYGGELQPLTGYLLTNGTSDIQYPDGTTPEPLFTYLLTEDLNQDGVLDPAECMNTNIDTCPPAVKREPVLYTWGDTNFDGTLSETEKSALRSLEVASPLWTANRLAPSGSYKSTTLAVDIDPASATAYEIEVVDGNKLGPGYLIRIGSGSGSETLVVETVLTSMVPHRVSLTTSPKNNHTSGDLVQVLPDTLFRAVRAVDLNFASITDRKNTVDGVQVVGRAGRQGTNGLDYRVTPFRRRIKVINMGTSATPADGIAPEICPLNIFTACSHAVSETSHRYLGVSGQAPLEFIVEDALGNPMPNIQVAYTNSDPSVGGLAYATSKTDSSGVAGVAYNLAGVLGTDTITARVDCVDGGGNAQSSTATNDLNVYSFSTTLVADCLSTVSSRNPVPATAFTLEVTSSSGPVAGHDVNMGLEFNSAFLPPIPDFGNLVGELFVDGSSLGLTDGDGKLEPASVQTDTNGQIVGSIDLLADGQGDGARLELITELLHPTCSATLGTVKDKVDFFSLTLDSTVPISGCYDYSPCVISAGATAPKVAANLSINQMPMGGAPLDFLTDDILVPAVGSEIGESVLVPETGVVTDTDGDGSVFVSNNGASVITPASPLKTQVDVSTTGPAGMCSSGSIESASDLVQFDFHTPLDICDTEMQDSWMVSQNKDKMCLHVRNENAADTGCPQAFKGIQISIYEADGTTLDSSVIIKEMKGGVVDSAPMCETGGAVTLFKDSCRSPKSMLANGEMWIFTNYDSCLVPFVPADPEQYFTIGEIRFDDDYPPGRPMDITVFYGCIGDCVGEEMSSKTFRLTTPAY